MKRRIQIEGMSCNHCVAHVKKALEELDGMSQVEVNLDEKCAIVFGEVSEECIRETIDDAGYDVIDIQEI
ncbi:MAG: copper ion binding protein [Cellulosilyticum sp.]|nr:heavy-metal-associated domain-containing protein [Cellulosilyticum sp.]MEE1072370.1 copper ion binding protein [Cellulosilyticum sp.]